MKKISLDDPIIKYLPSEVASNPALKGISIRNLCTHTSGLARIPNNLFGSGAAMTNPYKTYSKEKLFEYLKTCTTESRPGEKVSYSNLAVGLCGVILEQATGLTYEQMVHDIICKPLKMNHTVQNVPEGKKYLLADVYSEKSKDATAWEFDALAGAGALHSTVADLLIFAKANLKLDKSDLSSAMRVTHLLNVEKDIKIGLGWVINTAARSPFYWHNGGTAGSSSFIAFDDKNDVAIIVLSNQASLVDESALEILQAVEEIN
jgi:CubicO group peptidase (beta-lactamase class C family)